MGNRQICHIWKVSSAPGRIRTGVGREHTHTWVGREMFSKTVGNNTQLHKALWQFRENLLIIHPEQKHNGTTWRALAVRIGLQVLHRPFPLRGSLMPWPYVISWRLVLFVCFMNPRKKNLKKKGLFCNSPPSSSSVARNKEMKRYNDFTVRVFGSAPMNWSLVITGAAFLEKDVFSTSVSRLTENRSFPSQESLRNLLWFTCDTVFFKLVAAVNVWRNKGH